MRCNDGQRNHHTPLGLATVVMVHVPTAEAPILLHIGTKQPRIAHYVQQYGGQPTILVGTIAYNSRHAEPAGSFPPIPEIADQLGLRRLPAPHCASKTVTSQPSTLAHTEAQSHAMLPTGTTQSSCTHQQAALAATTRRISPTAPSDRTGTPRRVALPHRQLCHPRACEPSNCNSTTGSMDQS